MRNSCHPLKSSFRLPKKKKSKKIFLFLAILTIGNAIYFLNLNTKIKQIFVRVANYNLTSKFSNLYEIFRYKLRSDNNLEFEFYNSNRGSIVEVYFLNLLSTRNFNLADKLKAHVILLGLPAKIKTVKGNYLVVSGPYFNLKTVNRAKNHLISHKIKSVLVVKKVKNDKGYNL